MASAYDGERRRAQALAEIDRAKTAFFSNVSHEFRTPLTLMLGPLWKMHSQLPTHLISASALNLAHRNALRLLPAVDALLDFSRIEGGPRAGDVPARLILPRLQPTWRAASVRRSKKPGSCLHRGFTPPRPYPRQPPSIPTVR